MDMYHHDGLSHLSCHNSMMLTNLVVNFDINKMQFKFKFGSVQMLCDEKGRLSFQDENAKIILNLTGQPAFITKHLNGIQ